ncbi:MAG: amino acid permease [Planctomycetales bacterium]
MDQRTGTRGTPPAPGQASRALPDPLAPGVESRPGLLRALGLGMAIALVVGNVIGSGIFYKPGAIANSLGNFPLIIATWVVGGVICALGALCFAELAAMLPRAGGLYVYLREAYGRPVAFLSGWTEFVFGRPASVGVLSVAFILAFGVAIDMEFDIVAGMALALVLILGMAWVNVIGVIWGGRVQALTTLVKAGFLGLIAVLPFAVSLFGGDGVSAGNFSSTLPLPKGANWATQFAAAMLGVMWAYNGWHGVTPVAEEIRDPGRNIPLAMFGGLGLLIVLYVGANCAYHGVLTMEEISRADTNAAQEMVRKLTSDTSGGLTRFAVAAVSAVIMCSTLGAINSNMLNGPRISFAMGRDDVFFRGLGRVHAVYRTPVVAIVVQAAMSVAIVVGTAAYVASPFHLRAKAGSLKGMEEVFTILSNFIVFSASLFYMATVAAVIVLRVRRPEWERPYRTHGYPLVPLLYLAFYGWFLYHVFLGNPREAITGLVLTALGVPAYLWYRIWARANPEDTRDGV